LLHIATLLGTLDAHEAGYNIAREAISRLDDAPDLKHQAVTLLTMLGSLFKDADDLRADLNVLLSVPSSTVRAGELILRLVQRVAAKELNVEAACAELTVRIAPSRWMRRP
jgi:hypothetical protein